MKYVDEDGKVRMLIAEKYPFKGVENYFIDSLFYQDPFEAIEDSSPEDLEFSNETDDEPETEEECLWELNPFVMSINMLNFNNTTNVEGEWFINENLDLAYLSVLAYDYVPSDTSNDVDSDPLSVIDTLTSLYSLIRLSLVVHEMTNDA